MSGDLGASWKLAGRPSSAGDAGVIAAAAPGHLTVSAVSAGSQLLLTGTGGQTWHVVRF